MNEGNQEMAIAVRTAEAYAERDRRRMAELDALIESEGRCRHCGRRIYQRVPNRPKTPGICTRVDCQAAEMRAQEADRVRG